MDFEREGRDWPNRAYSRFVTAGGLKWHVQVLGEGPPVLLLHGTGASTHSWRALLPYLTAHYTIYAPDLPGHAFTQAPQTEQGFTLPGMATAVAALVRELKVEPVLVAGHSAGAAIAIRATLDKGLTPKALVSFNGALLPFGGMAGQLFSPLAKALVTLSWVPRLMTWRAQNRSTVEALLRDTGSKPSSEDVDLYARLFRDRGHVASTLAMMANWDLVPLQRDMGKLAVPLTLVASDNDKAIAPSVAHRVAKIAPGSQVTAVPGTGHLAHEERPDLIAVAIEQAAQRAGIAQRAPNVRSRSAD